MSSSELYDRSSTAAARLGRVSKALVRRSPHSPSVPANRKLRLCHVWPTITRSWVERGLVLGWGGVAGMQWRIITGRCQTAALIAVASRETDRPTQSIRLWQATHRPWLIMGYTAAEDAAVHARMIASAPLSGCVSCQNRGMLLCRYSFSVGGASLPFVVLCRCGFLVVSAYMSCELLYRCFDVANDRLTGGVILIVHDAAGDGDLPF